MQKMIKRGAVLAMAVACALVLAGCAATYTGLRYKDLQVQNKMSAAVFLVPVAPEKRTVFIQIRNTTDKPFQVEPQIIAAIQAKGYQVVQDPSKAQFLLQANILSVGETDESAAEKAAVAGFGGVIGGAAIGAVLGGDQAGAGAAIGGIAAGAAELIGGALVKVVTYMVVTDLQISERSPGPVSQQYKGELKQGTSGTTTQTSASSTPWQQHRTRIVSTARQTNLTFDEAYPALRDGLTQVISGLM